MDEMWVVGAVILLLMCAAILALFSRVEQPIATAEIKGQPDQVLLRLAEAVKREGFPIKDLDPSQGRLRIEGVRKILDLLLYRCWSKELIFQVEGGSRLAVKGKPSPWRGYASPTTPCFMTDEKLQRIVAEVADDLRFASFV